MATKNNPGAYDCYAAADPDEPIFVLRANDPTAAACVAGWAHQRFHDIMEGKKPNTPEQWEKISEALKCAADMRAWYHARHIQPAQEAATRALAEAVGAKMPEKPPLN